MKVIVHKETGEYGHYLGNGQFATSTLPYIYPDTMDIVMLKKYVMEQEGAELQHENYEVKKVELIVFD